MARIAKATRPTPSTLPICMALVAAVAVVYLPSLGHGFVALDDPSFVAGNPYVRDGLSWEGVRWAIYNDHWSWHPLTWLSHQLDAELFGLDPSGHHGVNVLLHAINTILVFLVLRSVTGSSGRSAIVAALFALHPLRVEAVAWIADRKGLLSTAFGLGAIGAYGRYARSPTLRRYLPVFALVALSLMSKAMWVTLPFVLLLLDYWPLRRRESTPWRLVVEKLPLLALSAATSLLAARAEPEAVELSLRAANAAVSYGRYLAKMVWPFGLAIPYPYPASWPAALVAVSLALLAAISFYAYRVRRERPWVIVGWLWYLGTLVPALGVIQSGVQSMADRFTYVPMIGLLVAVVWSGAEALGRRPSLRAGTVVALGAILVAWSARSVDQLGHWKSTTRLFEHATRVTDDNFRAHTILGAHYALAGDLAAARRHHVEALRIAADEPEVQLGMGNFLLAAGEPHRALAHLERAIALAPEDPDARVALGLYLRTTGRPTAAAAEYRRALATDPDHLAAHLHLGVLALERGDRLAAATHLDAVLELDPAHVEALELRRRLRADR